MCKKHKLMWWKLFSVCVILLLSVPYNGYGQIGIGGGFEYGPALFVSNGVFARRPALGITGIISYAPRDSKLFPSVTYLL